MDAFTNFLANNYVWFLIISLILIFALVGYLVDKKEIKEGKRKNKKEELKIVDFSSVDQSKSLNQSISDDASNSLNLDAYSKNTEEVEEEKDKNIFDKIIDKVEEKEEETEKTELEETKTEQI